MNRNPTLVPPPRFASSIKAASVPRSYPPVQLNALASLAFTLAAVHLFMIESRTSDFLGIFVGSSGFVVRVISVLALVVVAAAGGVQRALTTLPGMLLTAFTCWCILSLPFSVWRGGSFELIKEVWLKSYLFFIIAAGALVTLDHCRKAMVVITLAAGIVMMMTTVVGNMASGRLTFEDGLLGNANDLAAYLLTTLPFFVMIALTAKRQLTRVAGLMGAVLAVLVTLKTGSRSGLITAGFLMLVFFFKLSFGNKIKLVALGIPTVFLALMLAPEAAIGRYRTLFSDEAASSDEDADVRRQMEMARGSSQGRWALFLLSLEVTMRNPILGVGPGMFGVATSEDQVNRQRKLAYRESHMSYTQLSSETGIPGFMFYVGALFYCLRVTNRLYKQGRFNKDPVVERTANMAMCLNLSLAVYAVFACFGSIAYTFTFPVLAGLTVAFERAAAPIMAGAIQRPPNRVPEPRGMAPRLPVQRAVSMRMLH